MPRALGAPGWASYCVDGLGLTAQAVARHMKLEMQMRAMPTLRAALRAGRLTFTKACMVGREATPATIDALIDEVAGQPEHDRRVRKNRKRTPCSGRESIYGAREQVRHVIDAILSVQWAALCRGEGVISAGEALARLADHFVEVWKAHVRRPTRLEEQLIAQKDGFCAVPGCSRSLEHKHHIVLRSEGGIDAFPNRIGLCAVHHLAALHKGWLHIRGRNGERLLIQLAEPGPDGQIEAWVIHGDDGPVRAPPEPIHAARGPTWQRAEAGVTA